MSYTLYIPLTTIPEHDIEKGVEEDTDCVCNWNECSYTAPCCRNFGAGYVICSVVTCSGIIIALFVAFLHAWGVF